MSDKINLALSQLGELVGIPAFNDRGTISGWSIEMLPFLEETNLKHKLPLGEAPQNLRREFYQQPAILRCPTQYEQRDETADEIAPAHYVLVAQPLKKRKTFSLAEIPLSFERPWVVSPEVSSFDAVKMGLIMVATFTRTAFNTMFNFVQRPISEQANVTLASLNGQS